MKLSELIQSFKKEESNKSWGVNIEDFGYFFGLNLCGCWHEGEELEAYYHQDVNWTCTDTRVGIKFYFLKNKLVCVSFQRARKCEELFEFVSEQTHEEMFGWLVANFVRNNSENQMLLNMNEDVSVWIELAQRNNT